MAQQQVPQAASWAVWTGLVLVALLLVSVGRQFGRRGLHVTAAALAVAAVAVLAGWGGSADPSFTGAAHAGLREVARAFFAPLAAAAGTSPTADDGAVVLFLLVLLGGAYALESWTIRLEPPTIEVDAADADARDREKRVVREVQFRLPAVEVRRPALLPGGDRTDALAAVVERVDPERGKVLAALMRLAAKVWPTPASFRVKIYDEDAELESIEREGGAGRPPSRLRTDGGVPVTRITVDIRDARSGQSHAVRTMAVPESQLAEHVAGYAARTVFRQDWTTPRWAVGSFDGQDLAAYLLYLKSARPRDSYGSVRQWAEDQVTLLERATKNSPGAGVMRYELALLEDLLQRHSRALTHHAENAGRFPAFFRASYRLGMSLEMMAGPAFARLWPRGAELEELVRALDSCGLCRCRAEPGKRCAAHESLLEALRADPPSAEQAHLIRTALLVLADRYLGQYADVLRLHRLWWRWFRHREERPGWHPYLFGNHLVRRQRRAIREAIRVARDLVATRRLLLELSSPRAEGTGPGDPSPERGLREILARYDPGTYPGRQRVTSWAAVYNAACVHAAVIPAVVRGLLREETLDVRDLEERAELLLRRVIDDPDCEFERPYDWMSVDPDLAPLWELDPRRGFLRMLRQRDYPQSLPEEP
jgi:hypothetical protein